MSSADDARRSYVTPDEGSLSLTQAGTGKISALNSLWYGRRIQSNHSKPRSEDGGEGSTTHLRGRRHRLPGQVRGEGGPGARLRGARPHPRRGEAAARARRDPPGGEGAAFEVAEGEATRPETLRGLTRNCDVLFSSLGITRQRDKGVTYADVDYGANRDRSQWRCDRQAESVL